MAGLLPIGALAFVLAMLGAMSLRDAGRLRVFVVGVALVMAGLALNSLSKRATTEPAKPQSLQLDPLPQTAPRRGQYA